MKKYFSLEDFEVDQSINSSVVTIGMFDGVHLGHQKVIDTCCQIANSQNQQSVLITFSNHPSDYFCPNTPTRTLLSIEDKIKQLEKTNLDIVIVLPFDIQLASLSAEEFVQTILLEKLNCNSLVFGYDNHFGKNREGSPQFIDSQFKNRINSIVVNEKSIEGDVVSSSRIKILLQDGNIKLANEYLGYKYAINSFVVRGNALGRTIGFPTANYDIAKINIVIPANGVYLTCSTIEISGRRISKMGLTNIGIRPTVSKSFSVSIETYLLDFDLDIYDCIIHTEFILRIRSEQKFETITELKNQIQEDKEHALSYLTQIHVTA
jgi:riboflavin kinase/FMN adenylyltransferase